MARLTRKHRKTLKDRGIDPSGYSSSDLKQMSDQAADSGDLSLSEALTEASKALASPDEQLDQILGELKDKGIGEA